MGCDVSCTGLCTEMYLRKVDMKAVTSLMFTWDNCASFSPEAHGMAALVDRGLVHQLQTNGTGKFRDIRARMCC